MQEQLIKSLFKPFKQNKKRFTDFLDDKAKKNYYKHKLYFECSKSKNESCINTECHHNFLLHHETQMYMEISKEIQAERLAIKKRDEEYRKKHGYI